MKNKKKKTSLWMKVFVSFVATFVVFVYVKSDFFEDEILKFFQIFLTVFAIVIWSRLEDETDYEN